MTVTRQSLRSVLNWPFSRRFAIPKPRRHSMIEACSRARSALEEIRREKEAEKLDAVDEIDRISYERPLQIVSYPDPRLRQPNARLKLPIPGIEDLVNDMFNIMYTDDGIGLAAPQVGMNIQLMVFNPEGIQAKGDSSKEVVLINPRIVKTGKEKELVMEGCLSFYKPTVIRGIVERVSTVEVKAMDLNGKRIRLSLSGLPARIFLHEFDHLNGILFFDRMSPEVLDTLREDLQRYEDEFIQKNPDITIKRLFF